VERDQARDLAVDLTEGPLGCQREGEEVVPVDLTGGRLVVLDVGRGVRGRRRVVDPDVRRGVGGWRRVVDPDIGRGVGEAGWRGVVPEVGREVGDGDRVLVPDLDREVGVGGHVVVPDAGGDAARGVQGHAADVVTVASCSAGRRLRVVSVGVVAAPQVLASRSRAASIRAKIASEVPMSRSISGTARARSISRRLFIPVRARSLVSLLLGTAVHERRAQGDGGCIYTGATAQEGCTNSDPCVGSLRKLPYKRGNKVVLL
jgi:hypothetical protein